MGVIERWILMATVGACLTVTEAVAGAWVTPVHEAYVRVGGQVLDTDTRYDFEGEEVLLANDLVFRERALSAYCAMGVLRGVEANVSLIAKRLRLDTSTNDTTSVGLGDLVVGLKLGTMWRDLALGVQGHAKLPTGYDDEIDPPLGDGQVDVGVRLMAGHSLWRLKIPGYVGLEGGFTHRAGRPQDEWTALAEAGTNVFDDVGLRAKWSGAFARMLPPSNEEATDLFALDKRVSQIEGTLWVEIFDDGFLELGFTHLLSARNYTAGDAISVGYAKRIGFAPDRAGSTP